MLYCSHQLKRPGAISWTVCIHASLTVSLADDLQMGMIYFSLSLQLGCSSPTCQSARNSSFSGRQLLYSSERHQLLSNQIRINQANMNVHACVNQSHLSGIFCRGMKEYLWQKQFQVALVFQKQLKGSSQ